MSTPEERADDLRYEQPTPRKHPRDPDYMEELEVSPGTLLSYELDRERRRFEAAVAVMQGLLAKFGFDLPRDEIAQRSTRFAVALLAELEKERTSRRK